MGAASFIAVIAFVALLALATPLSARTAALMMSRFHLRVQPFAVWAALQPIPSMYKRKRALVWLLSTSRKSRAGEGAAKSEQSKSGRAVMGLQRSRDECTATAVRR